MPGAGPLADTGNEAPIEEFIENTGWMAEIAPSLQAMVVFAESAPPAPPNERNGNENGYCFLALNSTPFPKMFMESKQHCTYQVGSIK